MSIYFHEAVKKMKAGDIFRPDDEQETSKKYGDFHMNKSRSLAFADGDDIILSADHFNLAGVIIPAKKEMVSMSDAREVEFSNKNGDFKTGYSYGWQASAKNRDILYADLMEMLTQGEGHVYSKVLEEADHVRSVLTTSSAD